MAIEQHRRCRNRGRSCRSPPTRIANQLVPAHSENGQWPAWCALVRRACVASRRVGLHDGAGHRMAGQGGWACVCACVWQRPGLVDGHDLLALCVGVACTHARVCACVSAIQPSLCRTPTQLSLYCCATTALPTEPPMVLSTELPMVLSTEPPMVLSTEPSRPSCATA